MFEQRRLGKVYVDDRLLFKRRNEFMVAVAPRLVIVRAEHLPWRAQYEYVAWCQDFDVLEDCANLPEYQCIIHTAKDGVKTATFERQP